MDCAFQSCNHPKNQSTWAWFQKSKAYMTFQSTWSHLFARKIKSETWYTAVNRSINKTMIIVHQRLKRTTKCSRWFFWTNRGWKTVYQQKVHIRGTRLRQNTTIDLAFISFRLARNWAQVSLERSLLPGKLLWYCRHIKTGFLVALKRIDKLSIDHRLLVQLIREIKIQSYLNHPNIIKLYTFFSDQRYIYLTMELCCSGQLYSFLKKKRKLSEQLTKVILKDTLKALDYMHER